MSAAAVSTLAFRAFHNRMRALLNIDFADLAASGAVRGQKDYADFERDPHRYFIGADDERAAALWGLIEARQPAEYRA